MVNNVYVSVKEFEPENQEVNTRNALLVAVL